LFPPETAHSISLNSLKALSYFSFKEVNHSDSNEMKIMDLSFSNRLGLAAGMDKNADFIDCLSSLGFSFLELGTLTPRAQSGNLKPRLFRLREKKSLINSMGFNNKGIEHAVERVKNSNPLLLNPILFIKDFFSLNLNSLGFKFPDCALGVKVPSSKKLKPKLERQSIKSAFLSMPAASPSLLEKLKSIIFISLESE
jgi:hypothetical protein